MKCRSALVARQWRLLARTSGLLIATILVNACSSSSFTPSTPIKRPSMPRDATTTKLSSIKAAGAGREILMVALGLLDLNYRFGGKNPEAGLDCSGMVSYIYQHAVGVTLPHNAKQIARLARPIPAERLQVGDLVFFNTLNKTFSHMGIYIGEGKFVHAPRSNSSIRVDRLDNRYFASRFDGARTLFE